MYAVESNEAGFTSIPTSVYWAIVTITTVGYGAEKIRNDACPDCGKTGHDFDADYCKLIDKE